MSGMDEQFIWRCDKCGVKYNEIKLKDENDIIIGYIRLDSGPVLMCLTSELFKENSEVTIRHYESRFLRCDMCGSVSIMLETREKFNTIMLRAMRNKVIGDVCV